MQRLHYISEQIELGIEKFVENLSLTGEVWYLFNIPQQKKAEKLTPTQNIKIHNTL